MRKQVAGCSPSHSAVIKVKVHTLDIAPLIETLPQKRSGMARVLKGSQFYTAHPYVQSTIGMSHTCLYLTSYIAGTHLPTEG